MRLRTLTESAFRFVMSVRPSLHAPECISTAPTGQTSVKFDIGGGRACMKMSRNRRFGYSFTKTSGTFRDEVSTRRRWP